MFIIMLYRPMLGKNQNAAARTGEEVNESQGQGGISKIKFATVEDMKEPIKRVVVRKIDMVGSKQANAA
jgi:hypothetical protein